MPGQGQEGIEEGLRPFVFLISLSSRKVLFNGEGGNRAQASRPMRGRLEIIRGIAGRTAASESGGEVRLGEVMFAPRVSLTFDGPVPARHRSRKRWGSVSSIGVRHFFFFFFFYLYFFPTYTFSPPSISSSSSSSSSSSTFVAPSSPPLPFQYSLTKACSLYLALPSF